MLFAAPLLQAKMTARLVVRRAVFGAVGGLLLLIGLGFMMAALWTALAWSVGSIMASVILGLIFLGIGLLVLAFSRVPPRAIPRDVSARIADPARPTPRAPPITAQGVLSAFLLGLTAGRAVRRRE